MELNRSEIPRFAQNDKINYFFRSLDSQPRAVALIRLGEPNVLPLPGHDCQGLTVFTQLPPRAKVYLPPGLRQEEVGTHTNDIEPATLPRIAERYVH